MDIGNGEEYPLFSPTSDYPECEKCQVKGTDYCPALYRRTEHCPFYDHIRIQIEDGLEDYKYRELWEEPEKTKKNSRKNQEKEAD